MTSGDTIPSILLVLFSKKKKFRKKRGLETMSERDGVKKAEIKKERREDNKESESFLLD